MPFVSQQQLRKCFAMRARGETSWNCDKWLKETANVKKLPRRVSKKDHSGVMIALYADKSSTDALYKVALDTFGADAQLSDELHLTLGYFGKADDPNLCADCLARITLMIAAQYAPIECTVGGFGRFLQDEGDGTNAVYLAVDSPDLNEIHGLLCGLENIEQIDQSSEHGFTPHVTIGYTSGKTPDIKFNPFDITFDRVALAVGDSRIEIPLVGMREEPMNTITPKAVWTTAFVNELPDSAFLYVESGGKKVGGKTEPRSKRHFPYKDASGKIDLPHLRNAIARIPQSNAPGLNKVSLQARARKLLSSSSKSMSPDDMPMPDKEQVMADRKRMMADRKRRMTNRKKRRSSAAVVGKGSLTVFKQSDGKYRWVMYTSNPYRDKDMEYVTQKAHEQDIESLDTNGYDGQVLRLWHVGEPYFEDESDWTTVKAGPGADIGTCDFAAMHGRIRIESGLFYNEQDAVAIANAQDELEGSLAFAHPSYQPDEGGGFVDIRSFERSLTPKDMASNLFTKLLVSKETTMDPKKLEAFKALGVDIDKALSGAEKVQKKADKTAPYRMKGRQAPAVEIDEEDEDVEEDDLPSRLDKLTMQMKALQESMKEGETLEPEEKLEDMMLSEITVGEFQDLINSAISVKSANPVGVALKAVMEELEEIKSILTSKSVQSVVDEVARMKAKLERQGARLKATASKVRELDDDQPRVMKKGKRPSEDEDTLFDLDLDLDDADGGSGNGRVADGSDNPFSWIDQFVQKQ